MVSNVAKNELLSPVVGSEWSGQIVKKRSMSDVVEVPLHPVIATARFRAKTETGSFKEIRVICDSGAQANLLSDATLRVLGLISQPVKSNIIGINAMSVHTKGQAVLELWHRHKDEPVATAKFIVLDLDHMEHPQRSFSHQMFPSIATMDLADPQYNMRNRIDGIIGVDLLSTHLRDGLRRNPLGLLAQSTSFGWIVFGGASAEEESDSLTAISLVTASELYAQIRKLWEIDEILGAPIMSAENEDCEKLYQSTVVYREGRYGVTLLLKPEPTLGESRAMARRRLYCLETRFKKEPELKAGYVRFMEEYERLGHMKKADPLGPNALHYYIPHHAVSIDRKFRVVFDASAKTTNGRALNELQYVGPRLEKDLIDIVMNFRTGRIAMTADICKMFRQIDILPEQWDLQRILWRKSQAEPICEYWLTVVTYGMVSSPYNAVKTLNKCAIDNADQFPQAAQVVKDDFYMDDLLTSVESSDMAITLRGHVIALLRKGGFELAKWRSNCEAVLTADGSDNASKVVTELSGMSDVVTDTSKSVTEQDSTSVLGIVWNCRRDEFQFKVQRRNQPPVITKRVMTSEAARIYDPQGYVTPITIRAKLFIQDLWRAGSDWDAPLPTELQNGWRSFYEEIKLIDRVRIPRWLNTTLNAKIQIHLYCDASAKAYGAAAYVRVLTKNGWDAKLLHSKSRVAPIKPVTIPRLELCAVELGSSMLRKIKEIPTFANAPVFLWTDSEIVLYWMRKPSHELKTFVSNRVNQILQLVTIEQSRHVRSENNPADLLSRGVKAETLIDNALWWTGPNELRENGDDWPLWNPIPTTPDLTNQIDNEVKVPNVKFDNVYLTLIGNANEEIGLIEKWSSHRKVCRISAYVFRFCAKLYLRCCKRKEVKHSWLSTYASDEWESKAIVTLKIDEQSYEIPRPSVMECENALSYWTMKAQRDSFPNECKVVAKRQEVPRSSPLWTLTPQIDNGGLMRIYGRLGNTDLSNAVKHPIILHRKDILARRLAEECHRVLCHGGVQMCTQFLRHKYWIVGIRVLLRNVVYKCVTCTRYRQEVGNQFMADLPAMRLQTIPAFQRTGVDYAGPITLRLSRNKTTKGYIAVFVCMVYKAVHLELVSSLDAEAFIVALTRFVNLRAGSVRHLYSDNGTNFVKADKELQEATLIWQAHEVMRHLESQSIQWHFNVPSAPHHGGLWEAAVKSTKYHLKRMGGAHVFTFEELATLLAKIAACLNSRPLTPMSSDPNDLEALTPGHFLTGQSIVTPYEGYLAEGPSNRLSAWQKIQKL